MALPEGEYRLSLQVAGTEQLIGGTDVTVRGDSHVTAIALGKPDTVSIELFDDAVSAINENESVFRLINATSGDAAVFLQLGDGTTLTQDIAPGEAGEAVVEPGSEGVKAVVGTDESASEFDLISEVYGGVYYNAVAVDGSDPQVVLLTPISLAQSTASAPSATTLAAAPPSEVVITEPTAVVVAQVATATPAEVVPAQTEESQVVPAQITPPPATPAGPTARVVLDPGANLQLRQYPSANALSLGLAPSGTILRVNGRRGAPALPEGATPDPNATAFLDPATLVPEDGDLVPEETWLYVTYSTPDGGAIDAWINSLYVDLRDEDGDRMRLADLPTVPENLPGEARSTDITPPPIPEDRVVARIFNLDTGVNLNIRRTADTTGEVLDRVGNGTLTEFLGLKETGDWMFVRYSPAGGGTITGWVNATYVELLFNDQPITLEELEARELLVIAPDDERGEVRGDVGGVLLPTVDPLRDAVVAEVAIDPGANLHLRRTPDSNAESLALIPSATLLIVSGRTGESNWLQVEFEGVEGWVSSAYVRLTFNGAPFELANVPALTTPVPTTPTPVPAAPTATETPAA
jgi:SH3-like domain-containing protein